MIAQSKCTQSECISEELVHTNRQVGCSTHT